MIAANGDILLFIMLITGGGRLRPNIWSGTKGKACVYPLKGDKDDCFEVNAPFY